jgi:hypothetical protein
VERVARSVPWVLVLAAMLVGCHERPQITYAPPLNMSELAAGLPTPDNDFALLVDQPTSGRFGCPLAIAKLAAGSGAESSGPLVLTELHSNEQAYWTEQMRGVVAIQKLIFLRPRSIRPEEQSLATLCDTAGRLGAPLLLLYAPRQLGPNAAHVLGVLYEAQSRQPLATVRSTAHLLDEKGEEVSPNDERGDHRAQDAGYQAQRKFESYTLACLRELIHRDTRPATTQPHKWSQPYMERWWMMGRER